MTHTCSPKLTPHGLASQLCPSTRCIRIAQGISLASQVRPPHTAGDGVADLGRHGCRQQRQGPRADTAKHAAVVHTVANPGSRNSGTPFCAGEIHPFAVRISSGRTLTLPDSPSCTGRGGRPSLPPTLGDRGCVSLKEGPFHRPTQILAPPELLAAGGGCASLRIPLVRGISVTLESKLRVLNKNRKEANRESTNNSFTFDMSWDYLISLADAEVSKQRLSDLEPLALKVRASNSREPTLCSRGHLRRVPGLVLQGVQRRAPRLHEVH